MHFQCRWLCASESGCSIPPISLFNSFFKLFQQHKRCPEGRWLSYSTQRMAGHNGSPLLTTQEPAIQNRMPTIQGTHRIWAQDTNTIRIIRRSAIIFISPLTTCDEMPCWCHWPTQAKPQSVLGPVRIILVFPFLCRSLWQMFDWQYLTLRSVP